MKTAVFHGSAFYGKMSLAAHFRCAHIPAVVTKEIVKENKIHLKKGQLAIRMCPFGKELQWPVLPSRLELRLFLRMAGALQTACAGICIVLSRMHDSRH